MNPGSVCIPTYTNGQPHPHAMEAGSLYARYAILRDSGSGWAVELVAVPCPQGCAVAEARRNGRPDRSAWIAIGLASEC